MIGPEENIEDWFRQNADLLEVTPESEVWDRLNDSLDMDEVWGELDKSLDKDRDRAFWFGRMAVAAAILALFAFGLWGVTRSGIGQGESNDGNFASEVVVPEGESEGQGDGLNERGTSGSEGESLPLAENGANGVSGNENQGGVVQNDGEMIEKSEAVIQANGALAQNNGAMAQNNSVDTQSTNADAQNEIDLANHSYQSNSPVNDILQPTEAFILTPDNKNTQETSVIQEMAPDRTDLPVVTIELKPVDLLEEPQSLLLKFRMYPRMRPYSHLTLFNPSKIRIP